MEKFTSGDPFTGEVLRLIAEIGHTGAEAKKTRMDAKETLSSPQSVLADADPNSFIDLLKRQMAIGELVVAKAIAEVQAKKVLAANSARIKELLMPDDDGPVIKVTSLGNNAIVRNNLDKAENQPEEKYPGEITGRLSSFGDHTMTIQGLDGEMYVIWHTDFSDGEIQISLEHIDDAQD